MVYCGYGGLLAVDKLFLIAFSLRVDIDHWYVCGGVCKKNKTFWILFLEVVNLFSP